MEREEDKRVSAFVESMRQAGIGTFEAWYATGTDEELARYLELDTETLGTLMQQAEEWGLTGGLFDESSGPDVAVVRQYWEFAGAVLPGPVRPRTTNDPDDLPPPPEHPVPADPSPPTRLSASTGQEPDRQTANQNDDELQPA